jgi:hypothetical protein
MRYPIALFAILGAASALAADSTATIDVPGAQAVQAAVKSSAQRDTYARQNAAAFVLDHIIYAQAGERARRNALTSAESARYAELEKLRTTLDSEYEASLPVACSGHDCEERFAYNRCIGAYELSPQFYRAVLDKFFSPEAQKVLTPHLSSGAGTVWREALALPANSEPLDRFPPIMDACTASISSSSDAASSIFAPSLAFAPTIQASAVDDSIKRAKAAGVNTTVLGLQLGDLVRLPVCPQESFFGDLFGPGIQATCKKAGSAFPVATAIGGTATSMSFDIAVEMPRANCPDWMSGCVFYGQLSEGHLADVLIVTNGLSVQTTVGATLKAKYGNSATVAWNEFSNTAGSKVNALSMKWTLPGLVVTFIGYDGGAANAAGSILIETDAVTRDRELKEKQRQDQKQKL